MQIIYLYIPFQLASFFLLMQAMSKFVDEQKPKLPGTETAEAETCAETRFNIAYIRRKISLLNSKFYIRMSALSFVLSFFFIVLHLELAH